MAKKRIIVTGGAGFLGSQLLAALNERGDENILVVDRLGNDDKWRNLVGLRFEDIADTEDFRRRVREDRTTPPSTLFHFSTIETASDRDVDALVDGNFRFSRELCEWCLKHGGRFIHISTAATYGDGSAGFFDNEDLLPGLQPLDPYAWSKHLFDLWALQSGNLPKIAGLKLFSVYGPRESHRHPHASHVCRLLHEIQNNGVATLPKSHRADVADGDQSFDFTHVRDVVAMTLFLHDRQEVCGLFNCGTGRSTSLNDLARLLFLATAKEPVIRFADRAADVGGEAQHFAQADMTRLRAAGFTEPLVALEEGLRDCIASNPSPNSEDSAPPGDPLPAVPVPAQA